MDGLQKQIIELNQKVDQLHGVVERLSCQIAALTSDKQQQSGNGTDPFPTAQIISDSSPSNGSFKPVMEHKDILLDGSSWENNANPKSEQVLSPDIQIRRLTAQLTAAYNRIAALEEQLLARRIQS
ncbi:MAG: hypothetical protein AB4426_00700 [Xenococcaceae cyanobacterium]